MDVDCNLTGLQRPYNHKPVILQFCFVFCDSLGEKKLRKKKKNPYHSQISQARVASRFADIWLKTAVTERALFLHFESTWKRGNFRGGWIYNFILTWLILHREVFVQEAACLIMVQLCLTESKHHAKDCQERSCTDTAHKRFTWARGDVIIGQISWR